VGEEHAICIIGLGGMDAPVNRQTTFTAIGSSNKQEKQFWHKSRCSNRHFTYVRQEIIGQATDVKHSLQKAITSEISQILHFVIFLICI